MRVEIDQSGKIGDTKIATAPAFFNDVSYSIYISAVTKRRLIQNLRTPENSRVFYFRAFAFLLFILLRNHLNKIETICIDEEYSGREGEIKEIGALTVEVRSCVQFGHKGLFLRVPDHPIQLTIYQISS